jgi:hypothetical protein
MSFQWQSRLVLPATINHPLQALKYSELAFQIASIIEKERGG